MRDSAETPVFRHYKALSTKKGGDSSLLGTFVHINVYLYIDVKIGELKFLVSVTPLRLFADQQHEHWTLHGAALIISCFRTIPTGDSSIMANDGPNETYPQPSQTG